MFKPPSLILFLENFIWFYQFLSTLNCYYLTTEKKTKHDPISLLFSSFTCKLKINCEIESLFLGFLKED